MNFQIEPTNDFQTIREIALKTWPETYGKILSSEQLNYMLSLFYTENNLKQQSEKQQFILVKENDWPIAFAAYEIFKNNASAKIHKLYVLPGNQGKGIGKNLVEYILRQAKKEHLSHLFLNVNRNNPAIQFYQKLGFEIVKEENISIGNGYLMEDYMMQLNC
ncbi:GNAT family N-acetyltransferase [Flavobacterium sp. NST-5]|uniref:GNAT family N-acetyltransferase n=1 Tax=Flavobacterium ichthyis TaxID=2698827 RepID=A0ABW9ZBA6_9FLAO|nr:GNAT family N-acetyltransferase [Flavobacterium ichthyis]NBL65812.1 GNAT family N-acetyltransferase [Flavobacterium ichthyis]